MKKPTAKEIEERSTRLYKISQINSTIYIIGILEKLWKSSGKMKKEYSSIKSFRDLELHNTAVCMEFGFLTLIDIMDGTVNDLKKDFAEWEASVGGQ